MKNKVVPTAIAAIWLASSAVLAADVQPRFETSALSFSGGRDFTNGHLTITGPNDFEAEETSSKGLPVFRVQGGRIKDGFYHFNVTAATAERIKIKKPIDNGRGAAARDFTQKPFALSGMFQVKRGGILSISDQEQGADKDLE